MTRALSLALVLASTAALAQQQVFVCDPSTFPTRCAAVDSSGNLHITGGGGGGGSSVVSIDGGSVTVLEGTVPWTTWDFDAGVTLSLILQQLDAGISIVNFPAIQGWVSVDGGVVTVLQGTQPFTVQDYDAGATLSLILQQLDAGIGVSGTVTANQGRPGQTWPVQDFDAGSLLSLILQQLDAGIGVNGTFWPSVQPVQDYDAGQELGAILTQLQQGIPNDGGYVYVIPGTAGNWPSGVNAFGGWPVQTGPGPSGVGVPRVALSRDSTVGISGTANIQGAVVLDGGANVYGSVTTNPSATPVPVTGGANTGGYPTPILDTGFPVITANKQKLGANVSSPSFTTNQLRLLVVVFSSYAGATHAIFPVTISDTAGLTWTLQTSCITTGGLANEAGSSIWTALAPVGVTSDVVTVATSDTLAFDSIVSVYSYFAATPGISSTLYTGSTAALVQSVISPTQAGSLAVGAWIDGNGAGPITALSNTTFDSQISDSAQAGAVTAGRLNTANLSTGSVTLGSTLNSVFGCANAMEVRSAFYPVAVSGVYNTTQPQVDAGQVVAAQMTMRGGLIVSTGVDPFVPSQVTTSPPWQSVVIMNVNPLNPFLPRCNPVRVSNCQP
jgi:hypothetical protein